jgi:hypothetical protein
MPLIAWLRHKGFKIKLPFDWKPLNADCFQIRQAGPEDKFMKLTVNRIRQSFCLIETSNTLLKIPRRCRQHLRNNHDITHPYFSIFGVRT